VQPEKGEEPLIYPDNVIGERQVVRNHQIESEDNRMIHQHDRTP
jgi:hypothetical protein